MMIVYQTFPLHPDQSSTGISFWAVLVLQQQPSPLEALEDSSSNGSHLSHPLLFISLFTPSL